MDVIQMSAGANCGFLRWNRCSAICRLVWLTIEAGIILVVLLAVSGCTWRTVVLRSDPAGARVHVNGVEQGQTPLTIRLQWPDENTVHKIMLETDDYERQERRLTSLAASNAPKVWEFDIELARLARVFDLRVESTPVDASVRVEGRDCGTSPADITIRFTRDSSRSPWGAARITVDADEYERAEQMVTYEEALASATPWKVHFKLEPLARVFDVRIKTVPPGATVRIDGQTQGKSPVVVPVRFTRSDSRSPWSVADVKLSLENYRSEVLELSHFSASRGFISVPLVEVHREVPVSFVSNVEGAEVLIDNEVVGTTPLQYPFEFVRSDNHTSWSSFLVSVRKDGYRWSRPGGPVAPGDTSPFTARLTLDDASRGTLTVNLEPIRFVRTRLRGWEFTGEGLRMREEITLSQVDEIETEPMMQSVTRMTDMTPGEFMISRLSVAPPEQQLVYSVSFTPPDSRDEYANLWRQVGQGATRLTDGPKIDVEAFVSAEGEYVYFASNRLSPGKVNLWRLRTTGQGGFTKITDSPSSIVDTEPVVSPDGEKIAFVSILHDSKASQIWTANADGTLPTQIRIGCSPAWSPDGTRLAYVAPDDTRHGQIWVMNADGSNPTQLSAGDHNHKFPIWTPDGARIIYVSDQAINEEGEPNFDIWMMDSDGTNRTQLTVNGSHDTRPAVSPDGKFIYFMSNRGARREFDDNWQIWRIEFPTD